jgi:hypothetical protein
LRLAEGADVVVENARVGMMDRLGVGNCGQSIPSCCDQRRLSIEDRLALFVRVCEAVDYARQWLKTSAATSEDVRSARVRRAPPGVGFHCPDRGRSLVSARALDPSRSP